MDKEFVPYELALKLKELGFDDKKCLAFYIKIGEVMCLNMYTNNNRAFTEKILYTPLWQQTFDWFRINHNLFSSIESKTSTIDGDEFFIYVINGKECWDYGTYEEAKQACLEELIKIIESAQKNKTNS